MAGRNTSAGLFLWPAEPFFLIYTITTVMKINENYSSGKRKLKVYPKAFPRANHNIVFFPEIRLSGKWLQDNGFDFGQEVMIQHEKDKIVIIPVNQTSE